MPITLIDSHCHLDEARFYADREAVIARALAAGVTRMVTIGASGGLQANHDAIALAARHAGIFATVGIHPHEASVVSPGVIDELARMARAPKVVAIGETGLDYYYDHSPRPVQREVFRQFIQLARTLQLPVVVHLRDAYEDALTILREENAPEIGGVIHCFSGDRAQAKSFLDLGFDISFSGVVTFKNADELRAVARMVPADRFLVETDAPFLAPLPYRGKRNEPAYVVHTASAVAEARGEALDEIAAVTRTNTERRFRLKPEPWAYGRSRADGVRSPLKKVFRSP
ncbi:MAG: TatD family hydrolase [Candidatus Binatia bacterium]|jgi:TatD DNase family protein